MTARVALYYAPAPGSALARLAAAWLGRDPAAEQPPAPPASPGLDRAAITAFPRYYGFHATLKAPFALAPGRSVDDLKQAMERFAAATPPARGPVLGVRRLNGFTTLVFSAPAPTVDALAADTVRHFDSFRAPLAPAERERRDPARLTERQRAYLDRWGYPWVLEEFRFHMTLTGSVDDATGDRARTLLAELFAPFCRDPFTVDALALFEQPDRDTPFRLTARFPLSG